MDSSQAPYSVFIDFSNLASNSRRYSRFFIDSLLLFIAESQFSSYCLIRRVTITTPRGVTICWNYLHKLLPVVYTESQYFPYCLIRRVTSPSAFTVASHCLQRRVNFKNFERLPHFFKGTRKRNMNYACRAHLTKHIIKE